MESLGPERYHTRVSDRPGVEQVDGCLDRYAEGTSEVDPDSVVAHITPVTAVIAQEYAIESSVYRSSVPMDQARWGTKYILRPEMVMAVCVFMYTELQRFGARGDERCGAVVVG